MGVGLVEDPEHRADAGRFLPSVGLAAESGCSHREKEPTSVAPGYRSPLQLAWRNPQRAAPTLVGSSVFRRSYSRGQDSP